MPEADQITLAQANGRFGFKRIPDGGSASGRFAFVKAVGGDVTFDSGCTVDSGDAPSSGDVLQQGDTLPAPFTDVDIQSTSGGALYAYYDSEQ